MAEDGRDGRDAGVDEPLHARLGVVERLQLAPPVKAVGGHTGCRFGGRHLWCSWWWGSARDGRDKISGMGSIIHGPSISIVLGAWWWLEADASISGLGIFFFRVQRRWQPLKDIFARAMHGSIPTAAAVMTQEAPRTKNENGRNRTENSSTVFYFYI